MTAGRWRDSYRAELLRLRRWPALWVLAGVYPLLQTTFGFVLPYIAYRGGDAGPPAEGELPPAALLASMAPDAVPGIVTQGTPLFGGALLLILAALAVGGGYGWGTWKTVTTLGPGRTAVLGGTVAALGTVVVALVAVCVLLAIGCSGLVTAVSGAPLGLPPLGDLARAAGGAALVLGMWAAGGAAIGAVTRNPALATGLGLVWTLVVENLLAGAAALVDGLAPLTEHLPRAASGALAGALGATGTPGVSTDLPGPEALLAVALYLAGFLLVTALTFRRRDIS